MEHCPDWALVMFYKEILEYKGEFIIIDYSNEDNFCMVSQLVAEWLELDQIEWDDCSYIHQACLKYPIRFFSDEV